MAKKDRSRSAREKARVKAAEKAARRAAEDAATAARSVRRLERRLEQLQREQRSLRKRVKRLTRHVEARPPASPGRGGPPWARRTGPVVSLEVPLETDDPGAPLWATVAARLPEEITTVDDDGGVARYRYSAVGSTPQAPRYRRLAEPAGAPAPPDRPFPV